MIPAAALEQGLLGGSQSGGVRVPWYRKMRRCGQTNFNERDPIELNVAEWVEYWASLKLDALLLNAGGIVAFYPTEIPYHHRSQFLGDRDLFGDFTQAAKKRGMRVVARLDPNSAYEDAWKAHPEWFERNASGEPVRAREASWLHMTCLFSTYFSEQIPAIIREVNQRYDVDGFFTNGWPSTSAPRVCYCENCRNLGQPNTPEYYERYMARVLEIWKLWDATAKRKKWDSVYVGNLGGGIRAVKNVKQLAEVAGWFNADHQGRTGNTPIWNCAQQGRVAQSVMKGRTVTNVTGSYANSSPLWRHTSKAAPEATMWMAQTTASGMVPWYHWLGGKPQDLRWRETGRTFFDWLARHETHFVNKRPVANLGVVFSQRTNAFYRPPGQGDVTDALEGLYYALLEGRFCFDFVHEDDLGAETLRKYAALILPNAALLSDGQCAQLQAYVEGGGSLLATFETSLYDERGRQRQKPGLADLFGITEVGARKGPEGNSYYAHIERRHEILKGFEDTTLLPGAEFRRPVRAAGDPVLTVVPPYPAFPPEMVYPRVTRTDEPAALFLEKGAGRLVWFPGDIERSFWRSGDGDLSRLIQNSVNWLLRGRTPVSVSGEGLAEVFAWETEPGYAIHMLNYNNPNAHKGWFRRTYPIGPQKVRLEVQDGFRVASVRALRSDVALKHSLSHGVLEFAIPKVEDYEVAVAVRG